MDQALAAAKKNGAKMLFLQKGVHVVGERGCFVQCDGSDDRWINKDMYAEIDFSVAVMGEGAGVTIVEGGFKITGRKRDHVKFEAMTVQNPEGAGLWGNEGASFDATGLTIDGCGGRGVIAYYTQGTLTDCCVANCGQSGILSAGNGVIRLCGEKTEVTGNNTDGNSNYYGLEAHFSSSKIILRAPLTKESVSHDNFNGQNWGGSGTIEITGVVPAPLKLKPPPPPQVLVL
mgnify:FL=1